MSSQMPKEQFRFAISLSVLNHLGRNLYRNFITVLGEAISNSWDADAKNVWIEIDRDSSTFTIKDDGNGMSPDDFQNKFLKIGYSKRASGARQTGLKRPYIGAKGIGKLALLSCAKKISVFTKTKGNDYIGGVIDNSGLDKAIKSDLVPEQYPLDQLDTKLISSLSKNHEHGTIVVFEDTKEKIRNSIAHIRKMIALHFQFALIDEDFSIHVNGTKVTVADVQDLLDATEFVWVFNSHADDFVKGMKKLKSPISKLTTALPISGFIASVEKPRHLKISGTDERATIDLFVNGRLRERNIIRHIPTQRLVESYVYGQIHFDTMDRPGRDPFTSSREGVVEDDELFQQLLEYLKKTALPHIIDQWDALRLGRGEEGDDENPRKSKKQRRAIGLYNATREEFDVPEKAPLKDQVDEWLDSLSSDAEFNLESYVDCFLSENLVRKYLTKYGTALKPGVISEAKQWRDRESDLKGKANLSYNIRKSDGDLDYLGLTALAVSAEGKKDGGGSQSLATDAVSYAPVRNVIGHTGLLTDNAKAHLRLTYENIKARVRTLVSQKPPGQKK